MRLVQYLCQPDLVLYRHRPDVVAIVRDSALPVTSASYAAPMRRALDVAGQRNATLRDPKLALGVLRVSILAATPAIAALVDPMGARLSTIVVARIHGFLCGPPSSRDVNVPTVDAVAATLARIAVGPEDPTPGDADDDKAIEAGIAAVDEALEALNPVMSRMCRAGATLRKHHVRFLRDVSSHVDAALAAVDNDVPTLR